ncbi:MAG: type III pantothenate kinase [Bacillota bacterium]|nr:type III pantothenate kinase [Bacillota bacterium]
MLLVIDVGNTNIVLGVFQGDELVYDWRVSTDKNKTVDEYGLMLRQMLGSTNIEPKDINDIIISSVVPNINDIFPEICKKYFDLDPIIIGPGVKTGMNILYDNPKEVGADRIVNSVAAYEKYGGPLVVVDLGTAITFDAINQKGDYLGGAICPGIKISADALFQRASKLPKVEIIKTDKIIGKNTVTSMQAGIYHGYLGLIDSIIAKMVGQLKTADSRVKVISTGGYSQLFLDQSAYIEKIDPMLTLEGLKIIYERNKK